MIGVSFSESPTENFLSETGVGTRDIRIMTRKTLNEPGIPFASIHLSSATSFWLPLEPKIVF